MKTILYNGKQVKLTPLLMKSELVSQTRKGLKNQTRRLNGLEEINLNPDRWESGEGHKFSQESAAFYFIDKTNVDAPQKTNCPYGQKGDVIWVREKFAPIVQDWKSNPSEFIVFEDQTKHPEKYRWKPSIHMPLVACRLFGEILDVRPERLQDITQEDAIAEGIERVSEVSNEEFKNYLYNESPTYACHSFFTLWESINGEESLLRDPWVWRIEYKEIPKPESIS